MIRVKKFFIFCCASISLNAFGINVLPSFLATVNLSEKSNVLVQDGTETPNSEAKHESKFTKNVDEKFLKEPDDVEEVEKREELAKEELRCFIYIGKLTNEMGYKPVSSDHKDFKACVYKLMNFYNAHIQHAQYMKTKTEFNFCCGMMAYYLSDLQDIDDIKNWFKSVYNMEMTQQNGIKLIENSPGESAYWFTQVLKNTTSKKF